MSVVVILNPLHTNILGTILLSHKPQNVGKQYIIYIYTHLNKTAGYYFPSKCNLSFGGVVGHGDGAATACRGQTKTLYHLRVRQEEISPQHRGQRQDTREQNTGRNCPHNNLALI